MRISTIVFALLLVIGFGGSVDAQTIEVDGFESASVGYRFTNVRFVDYNGERALSIDVEMVSQTTLRSRNVAIAELELIMHSKDTQLFEEIRVKPLLFNSVTLGRVLKLSPSGGDSTADEIPEPLRSVHIPSRESHRGALLFILPDNGIMLTDVVLDGSRGSVRETPNRYIGLPSMNPDDIQNELVKIMIPTQPHVNLLNIYLQMREFERLMESLRDAW